MSHNELADVKKQCLLLKSYVKMPDTVLKTLKKENCIGFEALTGFLPLNILLVSHV
jgi:hypothetical protein